MLTNRKTGVNKVTKIDTFEVLTNLTSLLLSGNKIKDFSPIGTICPQLMKKSDTGAT